MAVFGCQSHFGSDLGRADRDLGRPPGLKRMTAGELAGQLAAEDVAPRSAATLTAHAKPIVTTGLQRPMPRSKSMRRYVRRCDAMRNVPAVVDHDFASQKKRLRLVVCKIGLARAKTKLGLADLAEELFRFVCRDGTAVPPQCGQPVLNSISKTLIW